jgi:hypothetical protein
MTSNFTPAGIEEPDWSESGSLITASNSGSISMLMHHYRIQDLLNASFFVILLLVISQYPRMFIKRHGKFHALLGCFHLCWLVIGFLNHASVLQTFLSVNLPPMVYDVVLGISGTALALTAAHEFQHKNVVNFASGTLDQHATVTYNEMIEHSFYQGMNLFQVLFLHALAYQFFENCLVWKVCLCVLVSSPWLLRQLFPVNKFSDNYEKVDDQSTAVIRFMYRVKKWQYVFYKHFLLHGLIISVAFMSSSDSGALIANSTFRMYWLLLNTSYVMEFFLQTLVKKSYMSQRTMLILQLLLMTSASLSAAVVLFDHVNFTVSVVSMMLNFLNRKQDFVNTLAIVVALIGFSSAV